MFISFSKVDVWKLIGKTYDLYTQKITPKFPQLLTKKKELKQEQNTNQKHVQSPNLQIGQGRSTSLYVPYKFLIFFSKKKNHLSLDHSLNSTYTSFNLSSKNIYIIYYISAASYSSIPFLSIPFIIPNQSTILSIYAGHNETSKDGSELFYDGEYLASYTKYPAHWKLIMVVHLMRIRLRKSDSLISLAMTVCPSSAPR